MLFLFNVLRLGKWMVRDPRLKSLRKDRAEHLFSALKRLRLAVSLLIFAVLIGMIGYRWIEHTSWFDAYYMSLVTLSTVGFGEVIPLDHNGRVFTSFLILFNIGFFAYAISTFTSIFADADLHAFFFDFNMKQRIQQLQRHTIVCGYGRHATEVCQELAKHKMPFVVIEREDEKVEFLQRETSYFFLQGDATADEVLLEAGVARASALVVTLPSDASNLFVVLSARQINPGLKIISRLNNADDESKLRRAGADHVIMPERIGGFYMATLVNKPDLVEFFTLISNMGPSNVVFEEISVTRLKEKFQNKSISQGGILTTSRIPIVGVRYPDGRYQLNPGLEEVLYPEMHIVVLGDAEQIHRFYAQVLQEKLN